jgi:hypothetical protein
MRRILIDQILLSQPHLMTLLNLYNRRFSEKIEFPNWAPHNCLELLIQKCSAEAVDLPESLHDIIKQNFKTLSEEYSGWGNAGDVQYMIK